MIFELIASFLAGVVAFFIFIVWVGTASIHRRERKERGRRTTPTDPNKIFVQADERPVVRRNGKGGGPDAKVPIGEDVIGVVTKGG